MLLKILFYVIFTYMQNICLIIGAGAGVGGNVAKVFAKDGYHVYLTRRSDESGLKKLIDSIFINHLDLAFLHL